MGNGIIPKSVLNQTDENGIICSERGIELIKSFEGFRSNVYTCAGGFKTIGYGHKLKENMNNISEEEALILLKKDIFYAERAVIRTITTKLNLNQFEALVSFTFNVGAGALQRSSLRQKINRLEFSCAENEFLRWVYVKGRKLLSLAKRRKKEVEHFFL